MDDCQEDSLNRSRALPVDELRGDPSRPILREFFAAS